MRFYILSLIVLNLIGFYKYVDYSSKPVEYRRQLLTDFFCPIGSLIGRIFFAFKLRENMSGYILGLFFEIFATIIFFSVF